MGSKSYVTKWIHDHLPAHRCYVEPFGGSGAVLLNKELSPYEVYNDLDSDVYYFFYQLREDCDALIKYLMACPASRELVETWSVISPHTLPPIVRAARFFVLSTFSFSGAPGGSFPVRSGFRRDQDYRNVGETQTYVRKIGFLKTFSERLMNVTIEHLDFRELIKRYDSPIACFYCDPPYIDLKHYKINFTEQDHIDLSLLLHGIRGKAIVSYYPHPLLDKLYPSDTWYYRRKTVTKQAGKGITQRDRETTELLIMNYDPDKDKFRDKDQVAIDGFLK